MARKALGPAALAVVQAVDAGTPDADLLVACSGGADSTALALAAQVVGARRGRGVRAVVVDHGLQDGSDEWAARVVERLAGRGIPAAAVRVEVRPEGEGIEAAAREARYRALSAALLPDEVGLLGHTLDDQAETVLLGLARGSGTRSLAGMPVARGGFVRPLLGVRSTVTAQACAEFGMPYDDDPHNAEPRFARARVRARVLPLLEDELGPGVAEALARTADLARADADALDALAAEALGAHADGSGLRAGRWLDTPAIAGRVVRLWLRAAGASETTRAHVDAAVALLGTRRGQKWLDLPGLRVGRRGDRLIVLDPGPGRPPGPGRR